MNMCLDVVNVGCKRAHDAASDKVRIHFDRFTADTPRVYSIKVQ